MISLVTLLILRKDRRKCFKCVKLTESRLYQTTCNLQNLTSSRQNEFAVNNPFFDFVHPRLLFY